MFSVAGDSSRKSLTRGRFCQASSSRTPSISMDEVSTRVTSMAGTTLSVANAEEANSSVEIYNRNGRGFRKVGTRDKLK